MTKDQSWRERLVLAWLRHQRRIGGELSQEWLAEAVSRRLELKEPLSQSAVSRWFHGSVPRDVATVVAIAQLLHVDPGWLLFGAASNAPEPPDSMSGIQFYPRPDD